MDLKKANVKILCDIAAIGMMGTLVGTAKTPVMPAVEFNQTYCDLDAKPGENVYEDIDPSIFREPAGIKRPSATNNRAPTIPVAPYIFETGRNYRIPDKFMAEPKKQKLFVSGVDAYLESREYLPPAKWSNERREEAWNAGWNFAQDALTRVNALDQPYSLFKLDEEESTKKIDDKGKVEPQLNNYAIVGGIVALAIGAAYCYGDKIANFGKKSMWNKITGNTERRGRQMCNTRW